MKPIDVDQLGRLVVNGGGPRLRTAIHVASLLIGLAAIVLLTYVVGSLTEAFYAARHATPAAGGTGDELGLELAAIFAMFIGFVASVPFGFVVYRYASKRLLKTICKD